MITRLARDVYRLFTRGFLYPEWDSPPPPPTPERVKGGFAYITNIIFFLLSFALGSLCGKLNGSAEDIKYNK